MNLVLSGPIDATLLATIERLSRPVSMKALRRSAWSLEAVDDGTVVRREVATCCDAAAVDHAYVEANTRFSTIKLLVLDMDSTLITIECIDELADFAGKKAEVAAITDATMRGEIVDFSESLRRRVALLEGLDVSVLERVYNERLQLSLGAEKLISAARTNGTYLLLVSGGFTYFSDRLRVALGLDAAFANQLETSEGKLTGRLEGKIIDASCKAACVQLAMKLSRCSPGEAIVIGDGANDIEMMKCVTYSIAYYAKSPVQAHARMRINHGSLETVLTYFSAT